MGAAVAVVLVVIGWATIVPGIFRGTSGMGSWYFFCACAFSTAGAVCMQQSAARNLRDAAVAGALGQVGGLIYVGMQGLPLSGEGFMWIAIAAGLGYAGGYMMLNYNQKKGS